METLMLDNLKAFFDTGLFSSRFPEHSDFQRLLSFKDYGSAITALLAKKPLQFTTAALASNSS